MDNIISTNPGKCYEVIGELAISSKEEVKSKVDQAKKAGKSWNELGVAGRVALLRKLILKIQENKEKLASIATEEMGMPIGSSRNDVDDAMRYFSWYLDNAERFLAPEISYQDDKIINTVYREPAGVVAVIVPWNYPMSNFVWGCGQNLVVGNTIVFKHSEECPLFGKILEEIVTSCLPEGVFSEVYGGGEVGDALIHENIDLICFTGSSKTGKYICQVAAEKFIRAILEMGGSAPGIIFEDANLDDVLETIYFGRFFSSGQSCDALKRLIVHESRLDETIAKLKKILESKKIGDPKDETVDLGPLVAKRQLNLLESQVADALEKGAKVEIGGKRPDGLSGAYYEPTILTNINREMRVWKEEVFGPVLPIVSSKSDEEALVLANDTIYGLGAYVYTENKERAKKIVAGLNTGMVSVNNASYLQPSSPFGGYKQSGLGREHGKYGFEELSQIKVVATEK